MHNLNTEWEGKAKVETECGSTNLAGEGLEYDVGFH